MTLLPLLPLLLRGLLLLLLWRLLLLLLRDLEQLLQLLVLLLLLRGWRVRRLQSPEWLQPPRRLRPKAPVGVSRERRLWMPARL